MINICISRVPGCCETITDECIVGDDISNNLILTEQVAYSAARAVIDAEATDKEIVSCSCSVHPGMKPGSLVEAQDREKGIFRGRLNKFGISISRKKDGSLSARSSIEIEKVK